MHPVSNNDTTELDLTTFRDSSEQNIAQLLARSPDVTVRRDGQLTYRGRSVSRVLVDGNDLFGVGQYAQPLARLSPDIVDGARAIERFHEDAVLARLEPSNETVIDLVTKAEARGTVDGQAHLAEGGTPRGDWRYRHEAGVILLDGPTAYYADATATRLASTTAGFAEVTDVVAPGEKRPEPIGTPYTPLPAATGAFGGALADAPAELIGDAHVADVGARALLRGRRAARTRIEVGGVHGRDEIRSASRLRAQAEGLDYRLDTRRTSGLSAEGATVTVDHYNAASSGKTSWRVGAHARPWRERSSATVAAVDADGGAEDFQEANRARDLPLYLGARLNRALGEGLAAQAFAQADYGALSDRLTLDADTALLRALGFGESRPGSVTQRRDVGYRVLRAGVRLFWRRPWASVEAFADATRQYSTPSIELARGGESDSRVSPPSRPTRSSVRAPWSRRHYRAAGGPSGGWKGSASATGGSGRTPSGSLTGYAPSTSRMGVPPTRSTTAATSASPSSPTTAASAT